MYLKYGFTAQRTRKNDCGIDIVAEYKDRKKDAPLLHPMQVLQQVPRQSVSPRVFCGHCIPSERGMRPLVVFTNNYMTKAARVFAKKLDVEIILKPELDETKEAVHRGIAGNPIEWGVRLFFSGHYEKQHHR